MKPKGQGPHDEGFLEYLEDIIGTDKYVEKIDESYKEWVFSSFYFSRKFTLYTLLFHSLMCTWKLKEVVICTAWVGVGGKDSVLSAEKKNAVVMRLEK